MEKPAQSPLLLDGIVLILAIVVVFAICACLVYLLSSDLPARLPLRPPLPFPV